MKRAAHITLILTLTALLLTGCSPSTFLGKSALVSPRPTVTPLPVPTEAPLAGAGVNGYDNNAGNCADAANQAINLINQAAAGRFGGTAFTMDMRLDLEPHGPDSGCADSPAHIASYRTYVRSAHLTVWSLDATWYGAGAPLRQQWLVDVLNALLLGLYPRANVTIQVMYNGAPCGHASIGAGQGGRRQIDAACA